MLEIKQVLLRYSQQQKTESITNEKMYVCVKESSVHMEIKTVFTLCWQALDYAD